MRGRTSQLKLHQKIAIFACAVLSCIPVWMLAVSKKADDQALAWFPHIGYVQCGILILVVMFFSAVLFFDVKVKEILQSYFTAETHPNNLAVFRIVLFGFLLIFVNYGEYMTFAGFPTELQFPPRGTEWMVSNIPINPHWAHGAYVLFLVFCFFAMAGLFSRFTLVMAALLGFYVLGLPQLYGKINHYQHLMWFMMILAASPCADALSIDAVMAARKRGACGITATPQPSVIYALPLRYMWILVGIIYFFPGFWKIWISGIDWFMTDNQKYQMYDKWMDFDGWVPAFRIDQYPLLYKLGGLGTIIFETMFIFIIFFPGLRLLAAISGLLFHNFTNLFMRIAFEPLQVCYVMFFDWNRIFQWIGNKLYKTRMRVLYDGHCEPCCKAIATIRVFDIFNSVDYLNANDHSGSKDLKSLGIERDDLFNDIHMVESGKVSKGFDGYRRLARRIPLFWPVVPFLYVWPVSSTGRNIYRRIADHRSCPIGDSVKNLEVWAAGRQKAFVCCISMVGAVLIIGNALFGITKSDGWPLASYPRFAGLAKEGSYRVQLMVVLPDGSERPLPIDAIKNKIAPERYTGLRWSIMRYADDPPNFEKKLKAFIGLCWEGQEDMFKEARAIRLYNERLTTIPEKKYLNPLKRKLKLEVSLPF